MAIPKEIRMSETYGPVAQGHVDGLDRFAEEDWVKRLHSGKSLTLTTIVIDGVSCSVFEFRDYCLVANSELTGLIGTIIAGHHDGQRMLYASRPPVEEKKMELVTAIAVALAQGTRS